MARFASQAVISADIGSCLSKNIVVAFGNVLFFVFSFSDYTVLFHGCKWRYFPSGSDDRQRPEDQEKKHIEKNIKLVFA